jgi:hypothetical protein
MLTIRHFLVAYVLDPRGLPSAAQPQKQIDRAIERVAKNSAVHGGLFVLGALPPQILY